MCHVILGLGEKLCRFWAATAAQSFIQRFLHAMAQPRASSLNGDDLF